MGNEYKLNRKSLKQWVCIFIVLIMVISTSFSIVAMAEGTDGIVCDDAACEIQNCDGSNHAQQLEEPIGCGIEGCTEAECDGTVHQTQPIATSTNCGVENCAIENCDGLAHAASLPEASESVCGAEGCVVKNCNGVHLQQKAPSEPITVYSTSHADYLIVSDDGTTITGITPNSGIRDLVIPQQIKPGVDITTIGAGALSGQQLNSVQLPSTITKINDRAFQSNPLGGGINLPEGITLIGNNAFEDCSGITSVVLPSSLTTLNGAAFKNCTSLASINWPANLTSANMGNGVFSGTAITTMAIPAGITSINNSTFSYCPNLFSITLPNSVKTIGENAFSNCPAMSYIAIPENVTSISTTAFGTWGSSTTSATIDLSAHLPNAITGKPWGATQANTTIIWKDVDTSCFWFDASTGLITGLKPSGHTSCAHTNWHTVNAGDWVIPTQIDGVDVLGFVPNAFASNKEVISLTFEAGSKVESIAPQAFEGCSNLTSIIFPEGLEEIGSRAFSANVKLAIIQFPSTLKYVRSGAFASDGKITSLSLPEGLLEVEGNAFLSNQCQTITIPSTVTQIADGAFQSTSLKEVTILGENALTIGVEAFCKSTNENVKKISIPNRNKNTVLTDEPWESIYAEVHWKDVTDPPVVITTADGWVFNTATKTLVKYVGESGDEVTLTVPYRITYGENTYSVTAPNALRDYIKGTSFAKVIFEEGFTTIPQNFMYNKTVGEVVLPSTVTKIEFNAFNGTTIGSVNILEGVTEIGTSAFKGCSLKEITLPTTLKNIGNSAFENNSLSSIDLYEGLTGIGSKAFANNDLTTVHIPATATNTTNAVQKDAFSGNTKLALITVNQYRKSASIKSNEPWGAPIGVVVKYFGDDPTVTHTVTQDNRGRIIDVSAEINELAQLNITGIYLSIDGGPVIDLYAVAEMYGKNAQTFKYVALENATYTFYFKTPAITEPEDYFAYEVVIDDIGKMSIEATNATFGISKAGNINQSEVLTATAAYALDFDSTEEANNYYITPEDMAKVNAMRNDGESVQITLYAEYRGEYDLSADVFKTTYDGQSMPVVAAYADGQYPYTNRINKVVTISLAGYVATFDANGGALPSRVSSTLAKDRGASVSQTEADARIPTREGFTFSHWALESANGAQASFPHVMTKDITFVAIWNVNYTVRHLDRDTGAAVAGIAHINGHAPAGTVIAPGHKNIAGYRADGSENAPHTLSETATGTVITYWYKQQFTVTWDANNGRLPSGEATHSTVVDKGTVVTLADANSMQPTRAGYTFIGWGHNGAAYDFAGGHVVNADVTFIALWRENSTIVEDVPYVIHHYLEGTTTRVAPSEYGTGVVGNAIVGNAVTLNRYFADAQSKRMTLQSTGANVMIFYYATNTYNVRFLTDTPANSGTQIGTTQIVNYGEDAFAPANPEREGYVFVGWDKSYLYITADTDVYALWQPLGTQTTTNVVVPPEGGGNNGGGETINAPAPADPRLAQQTGNVIQDIFNGNVPLASMGGTAWSLLSLLLSLAGICFSLILFFRSFFKRAQKEESLDDETKEALAVYMISEEEEEKRRSKWTVARVVTMILGWIPMLLFLILEDLTKPMAWINEYTLIIFIAFALFVIGCVVQRTIRKKDKSDPDMEQWAYNEA